MKGRDDKPGLDLLPEKKRMSYGEDLKKKLSSTIRGNKEVQSRDKFTKREVRAMWARHLKDLLVPLRNSEFDVLVTLKVLDNIFKHTLDMIFKTNYPGLCYRASD